MNSATTVPLAVAIIGGASTVTAALITRPKAAPPTTNMLGEPIDPHTGKPQRSSKALPFGIAGLVLWVIPLLGIFVILPGLWIGIHDRPLGRKNATNGLVLSSVGLGLLVINSAWGAYLGAHGQLWYQTS